MLLNDYIKLIKNKSRIDFNYVTFYFKVLPQLKKSILVKMLFPFNKVNFDSLFVLMPSI